MEDRGNYAVRYREGRWQLCTPRGEWVPHRTQQAAIDAAKSAAVREQVDVTWTDREGKPQGHARFRPKARSQKSFMRSVLSL